MERYANYGQTETPTYPAGDSEFLGVWEVEASKVPETYVQSATNTVFDERVPQTRPGKRPLPWLNRYVQHATIPNQLTLSPWTQIHGLGPFRDPNRREWVLIAADGACYRTTENNAIYSLTLPVGVVLREAVSFTQAFDVMVLQQGERRPNLILDDIGSGWRLAVQDFDPTVVYAQDDIVAYGDEFEVASISLNASTGTVTTLANHLFETGDRVYLYWETRSQLATAFAITVTGEKTFTFSFSPPAAAIGTKTISSLTRTLQVATATSVAHGLVTGRKIVISGATQPEYNGEYVVTVTGVDTFTYTIVGAPVTPATGSPTWLPVVFASRQLQYYKANTGGTNAGESPISTPSKWIPWTDFQAPWGLGGTSLQDRVFYPFGKDLAAASQTNLYNDVIAQQNVFRINQGDSDQLMALAKYNKQALVCFKRRSIYIASGLYDLDNATLDSVPVAYGLGARRAVAQMDNDLAFLTAEPAVRSIYATQNNEVLGRDQRLSLPIDKTMRRVTKTAIEGACMAFVGGKLFVGIPIDGSATNNAIIAYNTKTEGWEGLHQGDGIEPIDMAQITVNGQERMIFSSEDGCIYLWAEGRMDAVLDSSQPDGVGLADISMEVLSRGYDFQTAGLKKFDNARVALALWNPSYTLAAKFEGVKDEQAISDEAVTKSRTTYFDPWDAPPYDVQNIADDHATPGREDYSIALGASDVLYMGANGVDFERDQESEDNARLHHGRRDRVCQARVTNTSGFCRINAIELSGEAGERTAGVHQ